MSFIHNIKKFFNEDKQFLIEGKTVQYDAKKKRRKKVVINGEKYEMLVDYSSKLANINREILDKTEKTDKINKEIDGKISEVVTYMDEEGGNLKKSLQNIDLVVTEYKTITENVKKTELKVDEVIPLIKESQTLIDQLSKQLEHTNEKIEEITDKISVLKKRTEKIDIINETYKSIKTQISLLSLNATIEEKKTHIQNEGFIGLGENLKKLSDQSEQATIEIERYIRLINESIKNVYNKMKEGANDINKGNRIGEQAKRTITKTTDAMTEICKEIQNINIKKEEEFNEKLTESLNIITEKTKKSAENSHKTLNVNEEQRKELDNIKALSHELAGINKQIETELHEIVQKKT